MYWFAVLSVLVGLLVREYPIKTEQCAISLLYHTCVHCCFRFSKSSCSAMYSFRGRVEHLADRVVLLAGSIL